MIARALAVVVLAMAGMGAACQTVRTPPVVVKENWVWKIPEEFLQCARVVYPKAETLTDKQVARLIVALQRANTGCRLNMEAIRKLQAEALKIVEG